MRPAKNAWPEGESARGVMFVAQLFREMLDSASFESFRVITLDVLSRLNELAVLVQDAEAGRISILTIEPALAELAWALSNDPVVGEIAGSEVTSFLEFCKKDANRKSPDLRYLRSIVALLDKRIKPTYKDCLEQAILEHYTVLGEKVRLRLLVSHYCSHLINIGYAKRYIASTVDARFFTNPILKVEKRTLSIFFSTFTGEERKYRYWACVTPETASYLDRLGLSQMNSVPFSSLPPDAQLAMKSRRDYSAAKKYATGLVLEKDEYSAYEGLNNTFNSISAMTFLSKRSVELDWPSWLYIKTQRASAGRSISNDGFSFQKTTKVVSGAVGKSLQRQTKTILSQFDNSSTERLLSAVNTSALARRSVNPENQLISLWSAVEVLLSDPPVGKARIVHYVDALAPCICIKYVRRYIIAVVDDLLKHHSGATRKTLAALGLPRAMDQYSTFTHLIFNPKFHDLRTNYMKALSNNPLALHRLWKLHSNFSKPLDMRRSIEDHESRVRWQLHRIYRTRNHLVHSGRVPVFLQPLVMNAFEYFRSAMGPVFGRAEKEERQSDIDQLVAEISIDYSILLRTIGELSASKTAFNASHLSTIFR